MAEIPYIFIFENDSRVCDTDTTCSGALAQSENSLTKTKTNYLEKSSLPEIVSEISVHTKVDRNPEI